MIDVITHEYTCHESCIVSCTRPQWSCEECEECTDERYKSRYSIREMMECITRYSRTLEFLPDDVSSEEESSLQYHDREEYPECPEGRDTCIRMTYTIYGSCRYLDDGEYEEDRDCESRHGFSLPVSIGMIVICRFLSVPDSEVYYPRSDDVCR